MSIPTSFPSAQTPTDWLIDQKTKAREELAGLRAEERTLNEAAAVARANANEAERALAENQIKIKKSEDKQTFIDELSNP